MRFGGLHGVLQNGALSRSAAPRHLRWVAFATTQRAERGRELKAGRDPISGLTDVISTIDRAIPTSQVKRSNRDIVASRCNHGQSRTWHQARLSGYRTQILR